MISAEAPVYLQQFDPRVKSVAIVAEDTRYTTYIEQATDSLTGLATCEIPGAGVSATFKLPHPDSFVEQVSKNHQTPDVTARHDLRSYNAHLQLTHAERVLARRLGKKGCAGTDLKEALARAKYRASTKEFDVLKERKTATLHVVCADIDGQKGQVFNRMFSGVANNGGGEFKFNSDKKLRRRGAVERYMVHGFISFAQDTAEAVDRTADKRLTKDINSEVHAYNERQQNVLGDRCGVPQSQ